MASWFRFGRACVDIEEIPRVLMLSLLSACQHHQACSFIVFIIIAMSLRLQSELLLCTPLRSGRSTRMIDSWKDVAGRKRHFEDV